MFPESRSRRLRMNATVREMVRETRLSTKDLISPIFVDENITRPREIQSMPGVYNLPMDSVTQEANDVSQLGIPAVLLFGIPKRKDEEGSEAWSSAGVVQRAIRELKKESHVAVIADLCLCEYTSHGHCGVVKNGSVVNDETIELYGRTAVAQARAGADMVAPSGMMDGQISAIRRALDEGGFDDVPIMSYSAKYASAFYGPFRDAAQSTPQFGDRRTHQMDPGNAREALREMDEDLAEGADILMVKPALAYLDVIKEARVRFDAPIAAYNVSGEYSMIKAAAHNGWIDHDRAMMETLVSIKRAGADMIITYFAKEAAKLMRSGY
ncbi:MAG: porphobilinogen synthase [Methanomassiliicoccales archaeon]|jgi:porphobilinogen synthase